MRDEEALKIYDLYTPVQLLANWTLNIRMNKMKKLLKTAGISELSQLRKLKAAIGGYLEGIKKREHAWSSAWHDEKWIQRLSFWELNIKKRFRRMDKKDYKSWKTWKMKIFASYWLRN